MEAKVLFLRNINGKSIDRKYRRIYCSYFQCDVIYANGHHVDINLENFTMTCGEIRRTLNQLSRVSPI